MFSWTPTAGQTGDTPLTFTVTDNGTPPISDSETITITVKPDCNYKPDAKNDQYAVNEDRVLRVSA